MAGMLVLIRFARRSVITSTISTSSSVPCARYSQRSQQQQPRSRGPQEGLSTPLPKDLPTHVSSSPFYFETGYAGWSKRPSRPFPPPFFSPPSGSFSDPLSTFDRSVVRRPHVDGVMIRGVTIGDDAVLASDNLIGANDGVGAWAQRERGHAPLWSRLILHYLAIAAEQDRYGDTTRDPDPLHYLNEAYASTKEALSEPNEWLGTTTTSFAILHHVVRDDVRSAQLLVTQLGDSKIMVIRPSDGKVVFETKEQWHYFDCPRQLGTNSPDTPMKDGILDSISIQENDIVLAMTDGITDNLWGDEISDFVIKALNALQKESGSEAHASEEMRHVARELVLAARKVAEDPFAASPFMERAVDEGLAIEGGKLDDISVVVAVCRRR